MKIFKPINLLTAFLIMSVLVSCSKNADETIPNKNSVPTSVSAMTVVQNRNIENFIPVDKTVFVSCANNGNGEEVRITGTMNVISQLNTNGNRFTLTYHTNPTGVKAVGLTTGDQFTVSGGSQSTLSGSFTSNQYTTTLTEQFRLVGPTSTFIVRYQFQITIGADGEIIQNMSVDEADCRI